MTRTSIALWMLVTAIAAAPLWAGRAAGRDHDRRTLASPGKSQSRRFGATTDHANPDQVSQTIMILGRDGYRAVLALGEIAPEFEAKRVILAERIDGKPLDADHLRVVVPLDERGGRSVRDVARIEVTAPSSAE